MSLRITSACLFAVTALLVGAATPALALDRSEGDFWTYDMAMSIEGIDVTGELTMTFEGYDSVSVNGTSYEVGILEMSASFSGSVDLLGSPMVLTGAIVGTSYETKDAYGTVKEDVTMFTNVTWGEDPFQIVTSTKMDTLTTYSPPQSVGFDPSEKGPGDSWDETVTEVTTAYVDDLFDEEMSGTEVRTYSYSIASSEESITVPAGTFQTLKITETDEDGAREVIWYSETAGDAVKIEMYYEDSSDPYTTFELSDYSHETGGFSVMMLALAGVGIVVAIVVIVALFLLMKRRSGPTQVPPPIQPMPQVPPPPPPQQYPPSPPGQ